MCKTIFIVLLLTTALPGMAQNKVFSKSGMNEEGYLTQTTGMFFKGDVRFGFNLSRIFNVGKKRKKW